MPLSCNHCGSLRVVDFIGEYDSGVSAPDGGAERWNALIRKCLTCGKSEEL